MDIPSYNTVVNHKIDDILRLYPNFNPNDRAPSRYHSYLFIACHNCEIEVVNSLIECGARFDEKMCNNYTTLHYACRGNSPERVDLVKLILSREEGLSMINDQTKFGETALHVAIIHRAKGVVRVLLMNGADPHLRYSGESSLREDCIDRLAKIRSEGVKEWRPWNHMELSSSYRECMRTLLLLAKVV